MDVPNFQLPNVGTGPDPFSLETAVADEATDALVVLFQRDFLCPKCRQQVQAVAERYDEFEALHTIVVSVLPESQDRAAQWQAEYDLPFPLLADESKHVSDDFDQPVRFGVFGSVHDMIGRMPFAMVLDVRADEPTEIYTHKGKLPGDRPSIDDLLASVRTRVATDEITPSTDD